MDVEHEEFLDIPLYILLKLWSR